MLVGGEHYHPLEIERPVVEKYWDWNDRCGQLLVKAGHDVVFSRPR
jgi:hypothetical protein